MLPLRTVVSPEALFREIEEVPLDSPLTTTHAINGYEAYPSLEDALDYNRVNNTNKKDLHTRIIYRPPGWRTPVPKTMKKTAAFKRIWKGLSLVLAIISFARVATLVLEAYSLVRQERTADSELLDLCIRGAAQQSSKMRIACMQAQRDRASPVVFKAVLRACHTAWLEFLETVSTPLKFATVLIFLISALVMPVTPIMRLVFGMKNKNRYIADGHGEDDDDDEDDDEDDNFSNHVVVMNNGHRRLENRSKLQMQFRRALAQIKSGAFMKLRNDDDAYMRLEPGFKQD